MNNLAKFFCLDESSDVPVSTSSGPLITTSSAFLWPGVHRFNGVNYDCSRQGLYRFKAAGNAFYVNKVCWAQNKADVDIYALMSAIQWNHVHGVADNNYSHQATANAGVYRKWRSQCGYIAAFSGWLVSVGTLLSYRVVNVSTVSNFNGYDDGHVILETYHSDGWRMWDLTNGCYFRNSSGKHLSTSEFIAHIASNGPMPEKVKLDGNDRRWQSESAGSLDLGLYGEFEMGTPEQVEAWYRRIFQSIV
jgi:hypothetical protein